MGNSVQVSTSAQNDVTSKRGESNVPRGGICEQNLKEFVSLIPNTNRFVNRGRCTYFESFQRRDAGNESRMFFRSMMIESCCERKPRYKLVLIVYTLGLRDPIHISRKRRSLEKYSTVIGKLWDM